MENYLFIQSLQAKVPLLSMNNEVRDYCLNLGERSVNIALEDEAIIATMHFTGDKSFIAKNLRLLLSDIGPDEIDTAVENFERDHPLTPVECTYDDIITIAEQGIPGSYCRLATTGSKELILLTYEQECELLEILKKPYISTQSEIKWEMTRWFHAYRKKYGIEPRAKKYEDMIDASLTDVFCITHGIIPDKIKTKRDAEGTQVYGCVLIIVLILLAGVAAFWWRLVEFSNGVDSIFGFMALSGVVIAIPSFIVLLISKMKAAVK